MSHFHLQTFHVSFFYVSDYFNALFHTATQEINAYIPSTRPLSYQKQYNILHTTTVPLRLLLDDLPIQRPTELLCILNGIYVSVPAELSGRAV